MSRGLRPGPGDAGDHQGNDFVGSSSDDSPVTNFPTLPADGRSIVGD